MQYQSRAIMKFTCPCCGYKSLEDNKNTCVQWMAASCGKSKTREACDEIETERLGTMTDRSPNSLPLERVHAILDRMAQGRDPGDAKQEGDASDTDEEQK